MLLVAVGGLSMYSPSGFAFVMKLHMVTLAHTLSCSAAHGALSYMLPSGKSQVVQAVQVRSENAVCGVEANSLPVAQAVNGMQAYLPCAASHAR